MKTAIIVSGALRYMPQAASSWKFNGDYFLTVENKFYQPQDYNPVSDFSMTMFSSILQSKINFKSISIVESLTDSFSQYNAGIKMAWKWKVSHSIFKNYHDINKYDTIVITRPDLYVIAKDFVNLPTEDFIYADYYPHFDEHTRPWINDLFIITTPKIFEKMAGLYEYLVKRYRTIEVRNIHNYLFEYYLINDIEIKPKYNNFEYAVLRENCLDMFDNNGLKPEYNIGSLQRRSYEWWEMKYGKK